MANSESSAADSLRPQLHVALALVAGVACGFWPLPGQAGVAHAVMTVFMNALRLTSLPIIFLAVCTTIMNMPSLEVLKDLGRRVLGYTLLTTVLAASTALGLYLVIQPTFAGAPAAIKHAAVPGVPPSYIDHVVHLVPSSLFAPFIEGNVTAILLMSVAFGVAMLHVPERAKVAEPLAAVLAALLKVIRTITRAIPLVVWAGVVTSFAELSSGDTVAALARYLAVVVAANLVQAAVVLPLLLRTRGIAPLAAARDFAPALNVAFFSKSSVATLPVAMRCAEERRGVPAQLSRFSFPMCTSINMNGCAAFILTTVLFVSTAHGRTYTGLELVGWVLLASLAAFGNAGVPMGCYVLSCALLGAMDVPLNLMALVLPFYSFVDMLETAVNVWSDACVTLMVDRDLKTAGARGLRPGAA